MKAIHQEFNDAKHKMEQAKFQYMKQEMDVKKMQSENVIDMPHQNIERYRIKLEGSNMDTESLRQEKECMRQVLPETTITGMANLEGIKETLEKYLKETERLTSIYKQNERDFQNEQQEWNRSMEKFKLEIKKALKLEIEKSDMTRKKDAKKAQIQTEFKELQNKMGLVPPCTLL